MDSLPVTLPAPFRSEILPSENDDFWTFDAVEDRLIEAMRFAWRDQSGTWPFASDGPWHLMRAVAGDYDARGGDLADAAPMPRLPLTRAERARMDETVRWLSFLPEQASTGRPRMGGGCDARLVILATRKLAAHRGEGRGHVRWSQLLRHMDLRKGAGALAKRYTRAICAIAIELERQGVPVDLARG